MSFRFLRGERSKSSNVGQAPGDQQAIVERIDRGRNEAAQRLTGPGGGPQVSMDVRAIVSAAAKGEVSLLFISIDDVCWGRVDPQTHAVRVHPVEREGDEDLLRMAVKLASHSGSDVYAVTRDLMPVNSPIAAVLKAGAAA